MTSLEHSWQPPTAPLRIALLGDIHGNALALRRVLAMLREMDVDRVIILGDLLTYGCHPRKVLELTEVLINEFAADLLLGNHDQLYLDRIVGETAYFDGLPDWLKESIDWTCQQISLDALPALPWCESVELDSLFVAHANPFAYGDWTYLNSPEDNQRAIATLAERGFSVGVFGHTHRRKIAALNAQQAGVQLTEESGFLSRTHGRAYPPVAINAGSVGQPRHRDRVSTFLRLDMRADGVDVHFVPVVYDVDDHVAAIRASSLSQTTRDKLCRYF